MLATAEAHYARQQRISAAGLEAARRARFDTLDRLVITVMAAQLAASTEAVRAVPLMLAEQGINADPVESVTARGLVGWASDGRDLPGLLDYTRSPDVTATAFDLIVATQLQDVARAAASVAITVRPSVAGYVRMLNPPSCSRCVVQAGKWFRWNQGFQRHPKCDCRHVPASEDTAGDLRTNPDAYFESLSKVEQDKAFTKAGAEAIRDGADVGQVVNARAGMSTAQVIHSKGDRWTASGRLVRTQAFGQDVYATTEGMTRRGVAHAARTGKKVRLMPESIYEIADSRTDAIRLLKAHGYIT